MTEKTKTALTVLAVSVYLIGAGAYNAWSVHDACERGRCMDGGLVNSPAPLIWPLMLPVKAGEGLFNLWMLENVDD